jgi:hypothetical protein
MSHGSGGEVPRRIVAIGVIALSSCGSAPPAILPPAATVPPRGAQSFSVLGGSGGDRWSLTADGSGGSIDEKGNYLAGATGDTTDVVTVTDSSGRHASAMVRVGPGVAILPAGVALRPFTAQSFNASGGSGGGYKWSLGANPSGGTIDAQGRYTAGAVGGVDDSIIAMDSLGNSATIPVHVIGVLAVTPGFMILQSGGALRFTASGGQGDYQWTLSANVSGGAIDASGNYQAGSRGGTDVVRVSDAAGDLGAAAVRVRAPLPGGFVPAPHEERQIPPQGAALLSHATLVTITYSNDPERNAMEMLGAYLMQSNWLIQVGAEYGIGWGGQINVELPALAPHSLTDDAIQTNIANWISDGTLPGNPNGQFFYAMYLPATTRETLNGADLCNFSGGGYHSEGAANDGSSFSYSVISPCPDPQLSPLQLLQVATSHEFIEACTDPLPVTQPDYMIPAGSPDPWVQIGGEVADLCTYAPSVSVDGYELTSVWSNASSASGDGPCVPAADGYFSVSASPSTMQPVAAGQSVTFTLTGWSTAPMTQWQLYTAPVAAACCTPFTPSVDLAAMSIDNGGTTTLTIGVPAGTPSQSASLVYISSSTSRTNAIANVVGVYVP